MNWDEDEDFFFFFFFGFGNSFSAFLLLNRIIQMPHLYFSSKDLPCFFFFFFFFSMRLIFSFFACCYPLGERRQLDIGL
jgi:hypothetical protein